MSISKEEVLDRLRRVDAGDGTNLVSKDVVRALRIEDDSVSFVIEAANPEAASSLESARAAAEAEIYKIDGVNKVTVVLTAPASSSKPSQTKPPNLRIGRHPKPDGPGPSKVGQVNRIIAIGSGKGGVGKSTVSSNLAVALARQGRKVGLLDADIYGPSQPKMMGINQKPASPDGKTIIPLHAHDVTLMSLGFMLPEDKAVVWRGPMLMGALQQMLGQVEWGKLDVLLVDLPPGTGDVAMTLCQKAEVTGAIIVSTPQDVALLDARKAVDMFNNLKTPILGLIENMSTFICPSCGVETQIFGHGGVEREAERLNVPLLAKIPLSLDIRIAGDAGRPVAADHVASAEAFDHLAARLVGGGMA